jgi:UDP-N-acetyl-D-mannosaminuronic acid dehydrogenase
MRYNSLNLETIAVNEGGKMKREIAMNLLETPARRITTQLQGGSIRVCTVGMGHIGLPLALLLANQGTKVIGCDKNEEFLDELRAGRSPIVEHSKNLFPSSRVLGSTCPTCGVHILSVGRENFCPSCMRRVDVSSGSVRLTSRMNSAATRHGSSHEMEELLKLALKSGNLELTTDTSAAVKRSGFIVITVGTPIDPQKRPDTRALVSASKDIGAGLKKGSVVIVRSTVSVGTTEEVVGRILRDQSSLVPGRDFGLAHVPETTIEGLALFELRTLSKMIGGIDRRSGRAAAGLFGAFGAPIRLFDGPRTTEAAKLFLNIYRDVNIALANELALACEALGVDVIRVIEATRTDPKTNLLTPGPGVGGFCLTKDSFYLSQPASEKGFVPRLLKAAREVNDMMPSHVCKLAAEGLEEAGEGLAGSRIAILGLAFKGNTSDTRESPSLSIIQELTREGAVVVVHDPLVKGDDPRLLALGVKRARNVRDSLRDATAALLLTDHLEYRGLTGASLKKSGPKLRVVVDARHILDPSEVRAAGLTYRGVGHGTAT